MKQLVLDISNGETKVVEVAEPSVRSGGIIVKNAYSVISIGTEKSIVNFAKKNIIGKARNRPDLFKAFLEKAKRDGVIIAYQQASRRLEQYLPLGYSSAGIIEKISNDVKEFKIGERVACAGAEYAWHADKISVPKNMIAKVPDEVDLKDASFSTIASIALNGFRCANPELGHSIVIIGLGLIGLLTVQIAKAAGCKVIGIDLDERKVKLALELGADHAYTRSGSNETTILELTGQIGVDSVIITASGDSNDSIQLSGKITRKKGIVSIIGAIKLDIPREDFYKKELSIQIPSSYGPGRYDRNYEEQGHDYPIGFVRWTISRNMHAVLQLMKERKLTPAKIITEIFSIDSAVQSYSDIENSTELKIGSVIKYKNNEENSESKKISIKKMESNPNEINCGLIGGGIYATSTALPIMKKIKNMKITSISTASGLNAKSISEKYEINNLYSDYHDMLEEKSIELIIGMTRNSLHANIVCDALLKNKNVFVEKPLGINFEELDKIEEIWNKSSKAVMVGFNRRFAPFTNDIRTFFKNRVSPMIAYYRVNAENIPHDHWVYDKKEGSGRIISEACHFIDYLTYVIGSKPIEVFSNSITTQKSEDAMDNFIINISFEDGSIGSIIYTSKGNKKFSKEHAEFFADNKSAVLDNFKRLKLVSDKKTINKKNTLSQDKGHKNEFEYLIKKLKDGNRMEDEFMLSLFSSRATVAAQKSMITKVPEKV
jgi:predicted dehydrogenase/threonine dehydrogenase-like Zn-dependent dehydrogenase